MLEFAPVLPNSAGDERAVVVRNPCTFPIEFYSLEFDSQYLEDEKACLVFSVYLFLLAGFLRAFLVFFKKLALFF